MVLYGSAPRLVASEFRTILVLLRSSTLFDFAGQIMRDRLLYDGSVRGIAIRRRASWSRPG